MSRLLPLLLLACACGARHGDPLGPNFLPQRPQPTWGRTWRTAPAGPVSSRTPAHVADEIVGIERFRSCLRRAASPVVLTFRWTIRADGSVADLVLAGTTAADPRLERCLSAALTNTRFVTSKAESAAEWTFVHRLRSGEIAVPKLDEGAPAEASAPRPSLAKEWFRACYDAGRALDPGLNGHVGFRYLIDPSGRVLTVRDEGSNVSDREVVDCMAEVLYAQSFTPSSAYRVAVRTVELRSSEPYVLAD